MKAKIFFPVLIIGMVFFGCKKSTNSGCVIGGFSTHQQNMFWVSKDYGGGAYTVQVKDEQGNSVQMDFTQLSVSDSGEPSPCDVTSPAYSKHAMASLKYGQVYTYIATSNNRTFKGTIDVPCDSKEQCKAIKIDY